MAKYLAQSKHMLAMMLSLDDSSETAEECPHQQFLSTFIEAFGQSNSVKELELTCPGLTPTSESLENMLTRTKTLKSLTVYLKRQGHLEEAAQLPLHQALPKPPHFARAMLGSTA
jgi:hypothetical protein